MHCAIFKKSLVFEFGMGLVGRSRQNFTKPIIEEYSDSWKWLIKYRKTAFAGV